MTFGFLSKFKFHPSYLTVKIPALSALILTVIFTLSSLILIRGNLEKEKTSLLSEARAFSNLASIPIGDSYNNFFRSGYFKFREDIIEVLKLNSNISSIQIIEENGTIVFDSRNIDFPQLEKNKVEKNLDSSLKSYNTVEIKGSNGDIEQIIVPYFDDFGARPFSIRYFLSYDSVLRSARDTILTTLTLALVALLITLAAMTYLVYSSVLSPLGKIVKAAKEISHDNLSEFIRLNSKDELNDLANSLNQMTEKLKKSILDLKRLDKLKDEFIFLASHNLRTPLTIINGYTAQLKESKSLTSIERKSVANLEKGAKQLEEVTESLLNLVALEKDQGQFVKTRLALQDVLSKVIKVFETIAQKSQISIKADLDITRPAFIEADSQRLSQVFSGLIDNAIKFSKPSQEILVSLERRGPSVIVSVKDTGVGIAQEEQKYLFNKFHRATGTLRYDYKGLGLSLYLAKLIVGSHNGKIWFDSKPGVGSTFYVELPLVK